MVVGEGRSEINRGVGLGKAPKAEYKVLLLQFPGSVIETLEEAQGGHVAMGVEMVCNWKMLSFVMNRTQAFYKAVSKPLPGLTNAEEATLAAVQVNLSLGSWME
eukprot:g29153.t1